MHKMKLLSSSSCCIVNMIMPSRKKAPYPILIHCYIILATILISQSVEGDVLPFGSSTSINQRCQPFETDLCNIHSYSTVQPFRNTLGHTNIAAAEQELHKHFFLFRNERCKSKIQLFLCSLYFPVCVNSTMYQLEDLLRPCRDDCEEARRICRPSLQLANLTWPAEWNCSNFRYSLDDPLCVINNAKTSTPSPDSLPATTYLPALGDSKPTLSDELPKSISSDTFCDKELFDCHLLDPATNMKALCIEPSWVCDGKRDCVINGTTTMTEGLDELDCDKKCPEGGLFCDGRCISPSEICDGKLDCSSNLDEQDCDTSTNGPTIKFLFQAVLFLFMVILMVCLVSKLLRAKQEETVSDNRSEENIDKAHYQLPQQEIGNQTFLPADLIAQSIDDGISRHFEHSHSLHRNHIYHEPAYSISTRSDYERLINGGYSGASSVYASYATCHPDYLKEPPAPPPPTPAPQQTCSSSSITKDNPYLDSN